MRIEKRTMGWLPKPSTYAYATSLASKRRAVAQAGIAQTEALASTLTSIGPAASSSMIDITLQVAADRITAAAKAKIKTA
jgi:hypothetical protein